MNTPTPNKSGFTLIELLAALAIVAVVTAIGAPPLGNWLAAQRLGAELQVLMRDFQQARHAAVLTNRSVVLCPRNATNGCDTTHDWSRGWISFYNDDNDSPPRRDAGEELISVRQVAPTLAIVANRAAFHLRGDLRRATNGTIVICHRAARVVPRALVVSYSGRPRMLASGAHPTTPACP